MYARYFRSIPAAAGQTAEAPASGASLLIRRTHRLLAATFTLTVFVNFTVMAFRPPPPWVTYSPLPFLFLLMFSGLYLLSLPHVARWRAKQRPEGA